MLNTHNFNGQRENIGRLLVKCPDKPGIVAAISNFLYEHDSNIIESSQFSSDPEGGTFFIRFEYYKKNLLLERKKMEANFEKIAKDFSMEYRFTYNHVKKRTAIFVSKEPHCLMELLWEWQNGDLDTEIALVISNHEDAREFVEPLGIPYYHIPANEKSAKKQKQNSSNCLNNTT